jgi:hypothetical protein
VSPYLVFTACHRVRRWSHRHLQQIACRRGSLHNLALGEGHCLPRAPHPTRYLIVLRSLRPCLDVYIPSFLFSHGRCVRMRARLSRSAPGALTVGDLDFDATIPMQIELAKLIDPYRADINTALATRDLSRTNIWI